MEYDLGEALEELHDRIDATEASIAALDNRVGAAEALLVSTITNNEASHNLIILYMDREAVIMSSIYKIPLDELRSFIQDGTVSPYIDGLVPLQERIPE